MSDEGMRTRADDVTPKGVARVNDMTPKVGARVNDGMPRVGATYNGRHVAMSWGMRTPVTPSEFALR